MAGQQGPDEELQGMPTLLSPGPGRCRKFPEPSFVALFTVFCSQPVLHCEEKQVRTHRQVGSNWSASFPLSFVGQVESV